MRIADRIAADDIEIGIRAADVGSAGARLLEHALSRRGYPPDDVARIVAALVERERQISTVCSDTLALPHARDTKIGEFVIALGTNAEGVMDGNRALRVVVAFASPEGDRSGHLELLASLARLSRETQTVKAIAEANDAQAVMEILRAH